MHAIKFQATGTPRCTKQFLVHKKVVQDRCEVVLWGKAEEKWDGEEGMLDERRREKITGRSAEMFGGE